MCAQTLHIVLIVSTLVPVWSLGSPFQNSSTSKREEIAQPLLLKAIEADYPPAARARNVVGAVLIEFVLDESGNVTSPRVVVGHSLLREAAIEASKGWKFEPGKIKGEPKRLLGAITFCFQRNRSVSKSRHTFSFSQPSANRSRKAKNWCSGN